MQVRWSGLLGGLAAMLALMPSASKAQDWTMSQFDDGSYSAPPSRGGRTRPALVCGERSPQGLSAAVTGNTEPDITPAGRFASM